MHQMVSQTRIGDGVVDHAEGNPEACGNGAMSRYSERHASGRPCVGRFPSLIKMRMYSFRATGSNVYDFFYRMTELLRLDHLNRT